MYDVNYDEFEPVEPSGGTYSTARPTRKRHVGFAVAVSLLVMLLCAAMTVISLYSVHIERQNGATSVVFTERNPDISATPAPPETPAEPDAPKLPAAPAEELLPQLSAAVSLSDIYSKVAPSVVSVICTTPEQTLERCGVILSNEGYIITNCYVVRNPGAITVLMYDGSEHIASVVGGDPLSDLAVVKIDAGDFVPAEFGDSSALPVGEQVLSIGDPRGRELRAAMTNGILSGVSRDLDIDGRTMTILQTNANLPAGGYGGPLINMRGQVIGINAENLGTYASSEGNLGLAVPIDDAKNIVEELIEHGYIPGRPSIGLSGQSVTAAAQAYYRLPAGAYVEDVELNGPADRAGIQSGDIITAINDTAVCSLEELNLIKNRYKSGDVVTLTVFRDGNVMNVSLVLGEIR